ncbi:protein-disulfide reductase DsbD family protein [Plebeiibacterium sediminum]|uniref:Thioredoxin family protein n=1 Tax=Plebeiibacterium sediminum TaxID=2992112 RepID=A0AAE3M8D1_9BACT|nr:thioredoxin family protein [Plebeiobacterium sediminum]MCW3788817.1 thioredoxin family protein [Plebeiobacterium sediminum]
MKRKIALLALSLIVILQGSVWGQIQQPAKWKVSLSDTKASVGDKIDVVFRATIDPTWHLYSNDFDPDLGPILISFQFEENDSYKRIGEVKPINAHKQYDDVWGGEVSFFENTAEMRQTIEIKSLPLNIAGTFEFQSCSDKTGMCVMDDDEFNLTIKGTAKPVQETKPAATKEVVKEEKAAPVVKVETKPVAEVTAAKVEESKEETTTATKTNVVIKGNQTQESDSLWMLFIVSFLSGLAAIFTPCVFPMIPMTVSFFMHSDENKAKARFKAFFYGFSIIAIYTVIGTVVALTLGANFANFLSTHWLPNIFFFLIFMVFAASFFGMFEITMPNWLVNKSVSNEDKGGILGSFFMAFTLVLVSFSCTGPIVGAILVASAGGEVLMPIVGMLGFSIAFALPFTLFAIFPSWLNNLPKSGGWLNSVKVVLGFIEVALGLKFLSIADQTYHWGILDREIYLAIWIVTFAMLGFYFLGKLKFSHDSDVDHVSVPRLGLSIVTFAFVVYMIPGLFGAPLKALSGYIPPQATQDFDINKIVRENAVMSGSAAVEAHTAKYSDFLHLPHGLNGYFDYEEGLAAAKKLNKPVFIDFTGHGCVNCRQMEANVWSDPAVLKRLKEDYVVIALYVDDKTELPKDEWIVSEYDGKTKKTLGKKNADFQITRYEVNAQPYYCLLDANGNDLVTPRAYDLDVNAFVEFLEEGKKNFHNK